MSSLIVTNVDIKEMIKEAGLYQYQVAKEVGISEPQFIRWLRYDLSKDKINRILKAIEKLKGGEANDR